MKLEKSHLGGGLRALVLLLLHLLDVEVQLLALKDVAVAAPALARAGGDEGVETTGGELLINVVSDRVLVVAGLELGGKGVATLSIDVLRLDLLAVLHLDADLLAVVLHVPGTEGGSVNLHNARLHKGLGAHQLVVGRVVADVEDTSLVGGVLRAPGKVTGVEAESAELHVATTAAHGANVSMGRELGVGRLAAELVPVEGEKGAAA